MNKNRVLQLIGKVQHYTWGGHQYIPSLLHISNVENKPFAEYWLGAHQNASAEILLDDGSKTKLNEYIKAFPLETLGEEVFEKFAVLPYLLKILDVKDMLSIQVHPSKKNAEKEFVQENKKGIALNAPNRNYKDDNHKPELMLALGDFWLLHGFKPAEKLKAILKATHELQFLVPIFERDGYFGLYKYVMEMEQAQVNQVLQPLLDRILPLYQHQQLTKDKEDFWAARAALTYNQSASIDRGIFSVYIFNLLHLQMGEAIFQDAGLPHAYLEGQNVEIMANSDNVLRGGLTPKHIDVHELLKHVVFEETVPNIIQAKQVREYMQVYQTPAPDFELAKLSLKKNQSVSIVSRSTEIFIVMQGSVEIMERQYRMLCKAGDSFVSFHAAGFDVQANDDTVIYSASVAFPHA